jgi:hypothetical protein
MSQKRWSALTLSCLIGRVAFDNCKKKLGKGILNFITSIPGRNLSYGRQNDENKRAIKNAGGVSALGPILRNSISAENFEPQISDIFQTKNKPLCI